MKSLIRPFAILSSFLSVCLCANSGRTAMAAPGTPASVTVSSVSIPGPLRSFLRMAGISQKISADDVMPLLARNVNMMGYRENQKTEFLLLLERYLYQARELQILAGSKNTIHVTNCDDAGTLIQILGYRLRQECGQKSFSLETANPERAFLTIDSGFPLTELEEALQNGTPFNYSFATSRIPVLFSERDWIALGASERKNFGSAVDVLINDQAIARLYWALSKTDSETRLELQQSPGLKRLLPVAGTLDFYGNQLCIRSGRVLVPGGASAEAGWKDLVGAGPESRGEFVSRLLAKDNGWLAAYFDVLSRVSKTQQEHLTEGPRLKRFYQAFKATDSEPTATTGVFRKAPELLVLFTRVRWEANGEPHVPGDLGAWKEIFAQKTSFKVVREWGKQAKGWDRPEQMLEGLIGVSRIESDSGPLQIYLMLSEIDGVRSREERLSAGTVRLLADRFSQFSTWYLIFSEFPALNNASIARFLSIADSVDGVKGQTLRANARGAFQANVGLWQILARQGEIPNAEMNASWQKTIDPFAGIASSTQLFDAARKSLGDMLVAAGGRPANTQDGVIDLLAGPHQESPDGQRVHTELSGRIRSVLEDQRLVSLDTLFALSDGLGEMEQGHGASADRLLALAGELREFEMPRPIFTQSEKVSWAPRVYSSHHAELQIRTDLTKVIKSPGTRAQMEAARGQLTPFLRDTLVGLNYAYYEPPGAQILHNHPLFVRSHDFLGMSILGSERLWGAPVSLGAGAPAGGGVYLVGSLAELSYALAAIEQDFISPENVQALVWKELVPMLLVEATVPRWWDVSPNELHAVALYQRSGEEILASSVKNVELRGKIVDIFSERMAPQRLELTKHALLGSDEVIDMLPRLTPAETFYLAAEYRRRFPGEAASLGTANAELEKLYLKAPADVSEARLSKDFGVPHPQLTRSSACELLNVQPFPFFGGHSSRLFSESWDSSNLYWARLADEMGYPPVMLNRLVPELTRHMTAKIFATDLEDWPAMLRAMRETGDEFRRGKIALAPLASNVSPALDRPASDANAQ